MKTVYEMVKDDPGFKAFCRRRSTAPSKTMEQILADNVKKRAAEFRSFCKRRGILSCLGDYTIGNGKIACLGKRGDLFTDLGRETDQLNLKITAALEEQNRLLAMLKSKAANAGTDLLLVLMAVVAIGTAVFTLGALPALIAFTQLATMLKF